MNLKVIGGILIVLGTSIGAGMLALPVASAQEGFITSALLLIAIWMLMTFGAFLILEVNLWLPEDSNMISMAGLTLGKLGQIVTWLCYLLLFYSLICAYISGNSDVLYGIFGFFHIYMPRWLATLIVVSLISSVVYFGIHSVDIANRFLMGSKIVIYILLVLTIAPHINLQLLMRAHSRILLSTVMVMITSFGFASLIPSLRSYFNSNAKKLRLIVLVGSAIPLIFYIAWIAVIHGVLDHAKLQALTHSDEPISDLVTLLNIQLTSGWIIGFINVFTSICAATSFLGVALALSDFLADGLKISKRGKTGILVYGIEFIPPLLIVLLVPGVFITALGYAGIVCVVLLMLIPALMAWSGRYRKQITAKYKVFGGRTLLILEIAISIALLAWSVWYYV